jgi:hypothetical protein
MVEKTGELAWNLFSELRKELVEGQRLRTQTIGFKITVVGAGVGLIATSLGKVPALLLTLPAFAAIFFDFLIHGHSFSIGRIGYYCRTQLERSLRKDLKLQDDFKLWQEFLLDSSSRQWFAVVGNLGLTVLACTIGAYGAAIDYQASTALPVLLILAILLTVDVLAYWAVSPARRRDTRAVGGECGDPEG